MNDKTDEILSDFFGEKVSVSEDTAARLHKRLAAAERRTVRRKLLAAFALTALSDFAVFILALVFAGQLTSIILAGVYFAVSVVFSGILSAASIRAC